MTALGEVLSESSKAVVEAVKEAVDDNVEALPELENGKAAPAKPKRKYTKRAAKWGDAALKPATDKSPKADEGIAFKFSRPASRVRMNLADAVGEEVLMGAARFPIYAADMAGTFVSKGRFALIEYVDQSRMAKVDAAFKEGVLGSLEIECSPLQAYFFVCGGVIASALAMAGLQYAFLLKEKAGKAPPGFTDAVRDAARNGSLGGNGAGGFQAPASEGMAAVQQ